MRREEAPEWFDGAFGTYYHRLTGDNGPCERANVRDPKTVLGIHKEYIAAGARAIKTNTFCANPAQFPDDKELDAIIAGGWTIAGEAAAPENAIVFADIGYIPPDAQESGSGYIAVARRFLRQNATNFLFETLETLDGIPQAIRLIRGECPDAFIALSFAVGQNGFSRAGAHYLSLIEGAKALKADMTGLNCVCGPAHMLRLIEAIDLSGLCFFAMPNAGYPSRVNGRLEYRDNPAYFAQKLREMRALGVKCLGGCCGTTPEHIRLAVESLAAETVQNMPALESSSVPSPRKSSGGGRVERALDAGRRVVVAELAPPADADISGMLKRARLLAGVGVDAFTLPDSPLSRTRADSVTLSAKIARETGVEAMPHLTCRDRNAIAIQGALLACAIEGIPGVLALTGDPIVGAGRSQTDPPGGKSVFNFQSMRLIERIRSLNETLLSASPLWIAAALNVNAVNFPAELSRAKRKADLGARAFFTQAIFTPRAIENLRMAREALPSKILAGIMPVAGYKNAVFLSNEVPGIDLPPDFVEGLKGLGRADAAARSLAFARDMIDGARPFCDGFYLMTPMTRADLTAALVPYAKEV